MTVGERPEASGRQPRLWLIGTALALGVGAGLALGGAPEERLNPFARSPLFFALAALVQAWCGWSLIRAGERPAESILADLMRHRLERMGAQGAELKPLLWACAFAVLLLAGLSSTQFVLLAVGG